MKKLFTIAALAIATIAPSAKAQSVSFDEASGTLEIFASDFGDRVEVWESWNRVRVKIEYFDPSEGDWDDDTYSFHKSDVDDIVFYGGSGNDYFECEDDDDIQASCYLIGGDGFDVLIGGPNDDYIDGGYDGFRDEMTGGLGADTFVRWFEYVPMTLNHLRISRVTIPVSLANLFGPPLPTALVRQYEYESIQDFYSAEGDTIAAIEAP